MDSIFESGKKDRLAHGGTGVTRGGGVVGGAVSCQRDICSRVAQQETRRAANQKATKTTDGEPEKLQEYKNSFCFYLCSARMESLD